MVLLIFFPRFYFSFRTITVRSYFVFFFFSNINKFVQCSCDNENKVLLIGDCDFVIITTRFQSWTFVVAENAVKWQHFDSKTIIIVWWTCRFRHWQRQSYFWKEKPNTLYALSIVLRRNHRIHAIFHRFTSSFDGRAIVSLKIEAKSLLLERKIKKIERKQ